MSVASANVAVAGPERWQWNHVFPPMPSRPKVVNPGLGAAFRPTLGGWLTP